jgi:AbrB family looped-hinge helix DNA binding protein
MEKDTHPALVRVRRNGQITIPKAIRDALQIREGDFLKAYIRGSEFVLEPVSAGERGQGG